MIVNIVEENVKIDSHDVWKQAEYEESGGE